LIDLGTGCIAFATITTGGVLGIGSKERIVPWQAMTVSTDEKKFTLNVTREKFEHAPEIDRTQLELEGKAVDIYNYYGYKPYWVE
jgi:hypothetical protein